MFETDKSRSMVLKPGATSNGQCTCGDWSQMNGAVSVALGYANGCVAVYKLNSSSLRSQGEIGDGEIWEVYPIRVIEAHYTAVKTLKWSKLAPFLIASGSLFSREIKLWNVDAAVSNDEPVLTYEVIDFITFY